jgi:hypothetical protein
MSMLQDIPEATSGQKYHMNMAPFLNGYLFIGNYLLLIIYLFIYLLIEKIHMNIISDSQRLHRYGYLKCNMREQALTYLKASQCISITSASKQCSQTCRYLIKL